MHKSEDLGVGVEDLNDRDAVRSFAVALHRGHRWAKSQVGAIPISPVRRFLSDETRESFELIGEAAVHADRLFRIHEPDSHIVVRSELCVFTKANAQWFRRRGCFSDYLGYLVKRRGSGEVRERAMVIA